MKSNAKYSLVWAMGFALFCAIHANALVIRDQDFNTDTAGFILDPKDGTIGITGPESTISNIGGGASVNFTGSGTGNFPEMYIWAGMGSSPDIPNQDYKIEFDFMQSAGNSSLFQLKDGFTGQNGINIYLRHWADNSIQIQSAGSWISTGVTMPTNEWFHLDFTIVAQSNAVNDTFTINVTDTNGTSILSNTYAFATDIANYSQFWWRNGQADRSDVWNVDNVVMQSLPNPLPPHTPTNYFVSVSGDDADPGTEAQPFQTIQMAASMMREGDVCTIREGIYRETVTPAYSGTESLPIIFQAYSNETVEITGCEPVSTWTLDSGSIYKTSADLTLGDENQVFRRSGSALTNLWLARWPNSTDRWNPVYATADSGSSKMILKDSALPGYDWTGARIRIHQYPEWGLYDQSVTNWSAGQLNTDYRSIWSNHDLKAGSEYFAYNCYDALDADGEWFFDDAGNTLYVVSTAGMPGSGDIEVKTRKNAFDLRGRSYLMLEGLSLSAGTIETDEFSAHCTFDRLDVEYPYHSSHMGNQTAQANTGIVLLGSDHALKNSEIAWGSGSGVRLRGDRMEVVNCYIHDCNYAGSFSASLLTVSQGRGHVISHNTLVRTGRSCIDMRTSSRVLIQHNELAWCGRLTGDLGILYAPGAAVDGSELRYNWFHDNEATHHSAGIYFDNGGKNALIQHNVVWGPLTLGGLLINQYALGIQMYNNTLVNTGGEAYWSIWGNQYPDDMYGSRFINNVGASGINSDGTDIIFDANLLNYSGVVSNRYLPAGSPAEDAALIIPGITDGYVGAAPDIGAYERGGTDWTVGHDFSTEPVVNRSLSDCPTMNRLSNAAFEFGTLESWTAVGSGVSVNYQIVNQTMPLTQTAMGGHYSIALGSGTNRIMQVATNLLPNASYEYRVRLRADSDESVFIGVTGAGTAEVQSAGVSGNSPNWSDTRIPFTTGATNTTAQVYIQKSSTGSGTVYVDDCSVFYQGSVAVPSIYDWSMQGSNQFVFHWHAVSNKTYSVLATTNLPSNVWETNAIGIPGAVPAYTGEVDSAQTFYKIGVE